MPDSWNNVVLKLFLYRDLFYATLMATAFKRYCEELVHDGTGCVVVDETTWHHEHIGIVVLTDKLSDFRAPANSRTNALMLVERHGNTLSTTTDGNAGINLAAFNTFSQCVAKIGIVDGGITPCAIVFHRVAFLFQILQNELLQWKSCVVSCHAYAFYFHNHFISKNTEFTEKTEGTEDKRLLIHLICG